jgi:hypothetical protein
MDETLVNETVFNDWLDDSNITPIRPRLQRAECYFYRILRLYPRPERAHHNPWPNPGRLTQEELDEWKAFIDPPATTDGEIRQAQCRRQHTIYECHYLPDGTRREFRPPSNLEHRPPNDYDHLYDMRSYSPNGGTHLPDWDPEQIERENAFEPVDVEDVAQLNGIRPPTPPESPWPEPGSREALLIGSLGEDRREPEEPMPLPWNFAFYRTAGMSNIQVVDFAKRLLELPPEFRWNVVFLHEYEAMQWKDALKCAENNYWFSKLTPTMQDIYRHMQATWTMTDAQYRHESQLELNANRRLRYWLKDCEDMRANTLLGSYVSEFIESGRHRGRYEGRVEEDLEFFFEAIGFIDMENEDVAAYVDVVALRTAFVNALLFRFRTSRLSTWRDLITEWLDKVGNRDDETEGILKRGDFWRIHKYYRDVLEYFCDDYCRLSAEEAATASESDLRGVGFATRLSGIYRRTVGPLES